MLQKIIFPVAIGIMIVLAIVSCNRHSNAYSTTNKSYKKQARALAKVIAKTPGNIDSAPKPSYWVGTTNFNLRKPNFVVIHHTAQNSCEQTLKTFTLVKTQVSAHYVVCKDGTIHHMLNDYLRAWHGGAAKWGNISDLNSVSIGIELDNNGAEPFTETQISSLLRLLSVLKKNYAIPAQNFIGHADIAPTRKNDPSAYFPWQQLSKQGYGLWYDTSRVQVPAGFNTLQALRIIGYDIKDSAAAAKAFKLHFIQTNLKPVFTEEEKKILYDLMRRYQ
jgi:N-acetylmuramoyl-L-alanine amidase